MERAFEIQSSFYEEERSKVRGRERREEERREKVVSLLLTHE